MQHLINWNPYNFQASPINTDRGSGSGILYSGDVVIVQECAQVFGYGNIINGLPTLNIEGELLKNHQAMFIRCDPGLFDVIQCVVKKLNIEQLSFKKHIFTNNFKYRIDCGVQIWTTAWKCINMLSRFCNRIILLHVSLHLMIYYSLFIL